MKKYITFLLVFLSTMGYGQNKVRYYAYLDSFWKQNKLFMTEAGKEKKLIKTDSLDLYLSEQRRFLDSADKYRKFDATNPKLKL